MTPTPAEEHRFDLTELVEQDRQRTSSNRRGVAWFMTAFGGLFAVLGVYIGWVHPAAPFPADVIAGSLLIVSGAAAASASWVWGPLLQPPNSVVISADAISFGRIGSTRRTEIQWSNPRLHLILVERRRNESNQGVDHAGPQFYFGTRNSPYVPVPKVAFDLILGEAERHHLTVKRQDFGSTVMLILKHARAA